MIGIIGPMDAETDALFKLMTEREERQFGFSRFALGRLFGTQVVLGCAGIGKVHAGTCAMAMLMHYHPEAIITIGVAGALKPGIRLCDIVVAPACIQHDIDTTPIGDPPGLISGINKVYLKTDSALTEALADAARAAGCTPIIGNILSGDQFIEKPEDKQRLVELFDGTACDMESAAIAQICYESGVPYAVYRAVSDTRDGNGREYTLNLADSAAASVKVISEFIRRWAG